MAPAVKRRKLSHGEADEDDDSSSFASFGSDHSGIPEALNGQALEDVDDKEDDSALSIDGEDEDLDKGETSKPNGEPQDVATEKPAVPAKRKTDRLQSSCPKDAAAMSALKLTGGDQKASLLQLQIEELLGQVRPKKSIRAATAAEACLHELKAAIEDLSAKPPIALVEAERALIKKSRVATPFPDPRPAHDVQYKLEFKPPSSVNVVGSYASSTALRTEKTLTIDMMVQMPDALFQDKDYLDYRYFYRRAYYLACLAAGIRTATKGKYALDFDSHHGNPLCPILVVKPMEGDGTKKWQVNVLPSISRKVFTDDRLMPSKSLVRHQAHASAATPLYNSSIQVDRQIVAYLKLIHSASATCEDFKDASLLLRVWIQQRGFSGTLQAGGFGGFEATALLAILLSAGSLSPRYSTYQLFKATLQYLVTKDCSKTPLIVGEGSVKPEAVFNTPILFDAARSHNLIFKMTPSSYKALRQQARITLNMLADAHFDMFEPAFIMREDAIHLKYDLCLALPTKLLSDQENYDHLALSCKHKLYSVVSRGLGDRITHFDLRIDRSSHWALDSARPPWCTKGEIIIALRLNPSNASRTVDHGPPAEEKSAAADFRKFWGERAELRRFKDGSILESLVWSAKGGDQALIVEILTYLIDKHFEPESAGTLRVLGGDVARMITHAHGSAAFQPIMETFKTLETDIRSLDELPLTVRQVSAADPKACFASLHVSSTLSSPVDVVVQFESSARWPDDIHAIQRTKAAFLLKISSLFKESHSDLSSRVGLENWSTPTLNQSFLDLTYPACTFRIRIHHERETALLQRLLKDKTTAPPDRDAAATALAQYKRDFQASPAHTSAMVKLSTRFPALSATTRLLKKWFASHHLRSHFPEPVIELFAARTFLRPAPYPVPGSPKAGFLRTIAWLGQWDWRTEPLIVLDPAAEKADNDALFTAARTRFDAWRRLDPALNRVVVFAASAADPDGTAWTDVTAGGPSRVVVGRMTQLARAASELARGHVGDLDVDALFASSLEDYDFVLRLSGNLVQTKRKSRGEFKNLVLAAEAQANGGGFDPLSMFLDELRAVYGSAVVFFYGGQGSNVIAGLWNPVTAKRAWKVGLDYSTVPVTGEGEVEAVINKEGILAEIARLGGDLITRVEAK